MKTSQKTITVSVADNTLVFTHALTATDVREQCEAPYGPMVGYVTHMDALDTPQSGVYVITVDGMLVYVGKYELSFAKRWLYRRRNMIYHHKRSMIASQLRQGKSVEVWSFSCESSVHDVAAIERALIDNVSPDWNRL
jgi:hypothetical protein